jgi:tight adherence protein C
MIFFLNTLHRGLENGDYLLLLILVFAAVGLAVGSVTLLLLRRTFLRGRLRRVLWGTDQVQAPKARLVEEQQETGFVARVAAPLHGAVSPSDEAERTKVRAILVQAGLRSQRAYRNYLTLRLICAVLFPASYLFLIFAYQLTVQMMLIGLVLAVGGFYLPLWVVRYLAHRRRKRIWKVLPDALDLMVVCAEAGLGLDLIMRKVGEEIRLASQDLSDEFFLTNLEVQAGKSRDEAFKNMALRTGVPEVQSLLSVLAQASRFGTSIAQTLRVHADELRVKRRQRAEEKAATLAVKMIFPLAVFIFPAIFIVLVGPAGIKIVRIMFPILSGGG